MMANPFKEDISAMVSRFAAGQVTYYNSKFGVYFNTTRVPINTITIDEFGKFHGWYVTKAKGAHAHKAGLEQLAKEMQGIMKIHVAQVRNMQDPIIVNLN